MSNRSRLLVATASAFMLELFFSSGPARSLELAVDPRVDPADFRVTVFASGLNFPVSPVDLPDGSILVATAAPGGAYFASAGQLLRFVDADADGVADGPGAVLASSLAGVITSLRVADDLVLVSGASPSGRRIQVLRRGPTESDPHTLLGEIVLTFAAGWEHTSFSLAVEALAPGVHRVYFNVGSFDNANASSGGAIASGLLTGALAGGAIHRVLMTDSGSGAPQFGSVEHVATGVRNAAGLLIDPATGDLWFEDNGIDLPANRAEPLSADELNVIAARSLGGAIEDFGFPSGYVTYRTGAVVGGGVQPLVAFQPLPNPLNGAESEGAVEITLAPRLFPRALQGGMFVGFHGQFASGGTANEENPVVFVDRLNGGTFHFVPGQQAGLGHPNGLLATTDSLFVADLSSNGSLGAAGVGTGVVYQIRAIGPDSDGDGAFDVADNCPHAANPGQLDRGGVGASATPDGIGDACQCGDISGDGRVTTADAVVLTRALLFPPTAVPSQPQLCNVGGSSACSTADAVIVARALLLPATATVQQVCAPALP